MVKVRFLYHALSHGATNLNKINGGKLMFTVTVKNEMKDKTLCNILQIAFDGGINYWCRSVIVWDNDNQFRPPNLPEHCMDDFIKEKLTSNIFNFDKWEDADYDTYCLRFILSEPFENGQLEYDIFYHDLVDAVETWMNDNKFVSLGVDGDNLDAGDCDSIVQIALFGKVVFG